MKYATARDFNIARRMASGVVQAKQRHTLEDAPEDEVTPVQMLSPDLASALVEDLTALQRLPARGLDA